METSANKKGKVIALVLLPFKAFVVLSLPLYFLLRVFVPRPLSTYVGNNTTVIDPTAQLLLGIFAFCGPVLVAGTFIQLFASSQKSALCTLWFALVPIIWFGFVCFMWLIQRLL
jgi:hypothetical protein